MLVIGQYISDKLTKSRSVQPQISVDALCNREAPGLVLLW